MKNVKRPVKISGNFMDAVFARHPDKVWKKKKDGTVVVDMEHRGLFAGIAQKVFRRPRISHISLDKYGSTLWCALDGERTVADIVNIMKEAYPNEDRMLDRVVTFFTSLKNAGFIVRKES